MNTQTVVDVSKNNLAGTDAPPHCPHCGAKLTGRWERLTPGIIKTLVKLWTEVLAKGVNDIHLQVEMALNNNEYNNFQKLRYFGLVAKVRGSNKQGDAVSGHGRWLITRRGAQFLHGTATVNRRVYIFRNHIEDRSVERVHVGDVFKEKQDWPRHEDFAAQIEEQEELNLR